MAPSTPPPPSSVVLAAFTIASTESLVMSPRMSASRGSAMLRFVDQADAARVFVKRPRGFHRARVIVERKCFRFRMCLPPLGKRATDTTFAGNIEAGGEFGHVVKNQEAAGRERGIPKIELGEGRSMFVRTVENDQLRIAAKIFSRGVQRRRIERTSL